MTIKEVTDRKDSTRFRDFHKKHYRKDPNWVCPLDMEFDSTFDPEKNSNFKFGILQRWLLLDDNSVVIGRIAAFIDYHRAKSYHQPTGGLGFFEVIKKREAAFKLFDTAINWLAENGMQAVDGPITFGSNETNWGLLVDGFTQPTTGMQYHKKYYREYFEDYGFKNYFEQYSYSKDIGSVSIFPERFMKIANWISKRPGYSFRHIKFSESEKFVNDLVEIYNKTWSEFKEDYEPMDAGEFHKSLKKSRAFIDEELIWFAYKDDKPIAFYIIFPDLNQILKHLNGRLHLWNKIKFFYLKKTRTMTRMRALAAGVIPEYRNSGVESAIFRCLYDVFMKKRFYKELELSWVGDFNEKMISIYEALDAHRIKTHISYRYMINRELKFTRLKDEMDELISQKGNDQLQNK